MTQTDDAMKRVTAEKLDDLWEEFEASAKPVSFDGDIEFFNVEDMQDQAYYLYEAAKSLLATQPDPLADPRVKALVEVLERLVGEYADDADFQAEFAEENRSYEEADQARSTAELWRNALTALAAFNTGDKADE